MNDGRDLLFVTLEMLRRPPDRGPRMNELVRPEFQIRNRVVEQGEVLPEPTNAGVAGAAEQSTDFSCFVIVIDAARYAFAESSVADCAYTVLPREYFVVFLMRDAVFRLQMLGISSSFAFFGSSVAALLF